MDRDRLLAELAEVAKECAKSGWDGWGAKPVSPRAIEVARQLVSRGVLDPRGCEASADPDGDVALDWTSGVSMSISRRGGISVAMEESDGG